MKEQPNIRIALTGDSIIARRISVHNDEPTTALYEKLREADVRFTNLEVLPNDFKGHPAARSDGAHFAAHSYVLDDLKELGFNLLSCANNHCLDYGVDGLLTTIEEIEKRGFSYAGVGKNLTEARMPVYHDVPGGTVAMLSATSTFFIEDQAGEARSEVQGRPGSNPLKFDVEYQVTEEQMKVIKEVDEQLGFGEHRREFIRLGFGAPPADPDIYQFEDSNFRVAGTLAASFRVGDEPKVISRPNEKDLNDIIKWVREAKSRADVVIMSLHAHEQSITREHPAEFIREFAHRIIDEGADVVAIHGPHLIRGMEMYKGKPIFYSLANFIGHNELVYKLPQDSYNRFKVDASMTPSEIFHKRSDGGKKGFPGSALYWQSFMPVCHFKDGKLNEIEILPVGLTRGDTPHHRGRPYLATGEQGREIMKKLDDLSKEFGTDLVIDEDGRAIVKLD